MRISIVAVGRRMPDWVQAGFKEYKKRLSHELALELIEVLPARRSKNSLEDKLKQEEAEAILRAVPENTRIIALDETGRKQTTKKLAACLGNWARDGEHICFIIGGADGLAAAVLKKADETWSLSDYTLPHALVRVILAEQLYRAWSLLKGHPYHRE
ncbi:MAG: 23S rRNA (pseudouridine(1915)-N(3))-methyltransferase RlmH [Gammaproteobacteria bacterium]